MRVILMAFHPRWAELILSEAKNCEVRKVAPNIELPAKILIYMTKQKWEFKLLPKLAGKQGTIVGEFFCDKFVSIIPHDDGYGVNQYEFTAPHDVVHTCLPFEEMKSYLGESEGCGIMVAKGTVLSYDEPKQLSDFTVPSRDAVRECPNRIRISTNQEMTNGAALPGGYICSENSYQPKWCTKCLRRPLTRAPQSYMFVEEAE